MRRTIIVIGGRNVNSFIKNPKWIICGAFLAAILAFFAWIYGWGGGEIHAMNFSAEDVERLTLSQSGYTYAVEVTGKEDIQAVIDMVNSFRHTGNELKHGLRFGYGGTCLYEFDVYLKNGEEFPFFFGSNSGDQPVSDMEVSYWVYQETKISRAPSKLCRGSMELFFEMYEKYRPVV